MERCCREAKGGSHCTKRKRDHLLPWTNLRLVSSHSRSMAAVVEEQCLELPASCAGPVPHSSVVIGDCSVMEMDLEEPDTLASTKVGLGADLAVLDISLQEQCNAVAVETKSSMGCWGAILVVTVLRLNVPEIFDHRP